MVQMQILWNKEIEEIKKSGYLNKNISVTDALIENFYNEIMCPEEKDLIDVIFSVNPTQDDLEKVLQRWDIEVKQGSKSLLLAYFMKKHPELDFHKYNAPRLNGLLLNLRFKNLQITAHYKKIGQELNKHNIIPLIIKGGAMRYLIPDLPRYMGDVDVLVPAKNWKKSEKIIKNLGYYPKRLDVHSFDVLENKDSEYGILDVHKFIFMETNKKTQWLKGLFKRAEEKEIFGVKTLLPCMEDLMFITLTNLASNLRDCKSQAGILFALFDCKYFLESKPDFDWDIVKNNAKKTGTEVQINFAIKFINKISESIIPKEIQHDMLFEKETNDYSRVVMFKRFYYAELQKECRSMKISEVLKNPLTLGKYLKLKTKYKTLKLLGNHPRLIEIFIKDLNKVYSTIQG